jgi:hypothetical protein
VELKCNLFSKVKIFSVDTLIIFKLEGDEACCLTCEKMIPKDVKNYNLNYNKDC